MSSNQLTTTRSMNGIINVYSEDIQVNTLQANNIITDDLTINNELNVNNTNILPSELAQLDGVNTNETIQQQLDSINGDLSNVVTISGNQTITGSKIFSTTTEQNGVLLLRNNLNVNNINISPTELSFLDGATSNLQDQINAAVVGVTLGTDQVISGFKAFINGIQTPFIENQDVTGTVNGYFYDNYNLLYTSYTGTYTINVSKLTGIDSNNNIITTFDTVNKVVTITTALTPKSPIYTLESYKPQDATTEIFVWGGTSNLAQNQGVIFNNLIDFIDVINTNSYLPLNASSVTTSYIGDVQGYISSGQLITADSITLDNFFEGTGMIRPVVVRDQFPVLTNSYLLQSPNVITDESIKSSPLGFIKNNNFWLRASYSLADNNFVEGSTTTVPTGCQIINANVNSYQYTISVSDSPSYLTQYGFVSASVLKIYDTTGIITLTGLYNVTDNDGQYGIISNVSGNIVSFLKGVIYNGVATTAKAYINSNLDLVCLTDFTNKFIAESTISQVDFRYTGTNAYSISSPNPLFADSYGSTYGYKYDANTLITETKLNDDFLFELPNELNQLGSYASTLNSHLLSVIESDYVTPIKSGTYKCVLATISTATYILFGAYDVGNTQDFAVNASLAPYTSCCEIELPFNPPYVFNGLRINALENSLTLSTPYINNIDYAIHLGQYYLFNTTNTININDVICKNTSNAFINGRYIATRIGNGLKATQLNQNYTEATQTPRAVNRTWSKTKLNDLLTPTNEYNGQTRPQVGNFLICHVSSYIVAMITAVTTVGSNYSVTLSPNVNLGGLVSGTDLYLYTTYGTIANGFYTPVDFDLYASTVVRRYTEEKDFYDKKTYDFYNLETNDVYENRTYGQYQNANTSIYSNNLYNIDTTVQIDLPNTGVPDTFVVEDLAQDLSNKTFTDNTTFQQGLTASGTITTQYLTASRDITCLDLDASRDVNSVDFNGTGLLTLSDDEKEHIISNNLYIGRLFSATSNNYGIGIGGTSWTDAYDNNTFVLTKNVSNNFTVLNSPAEVWTTINNSLRLKVADEVVEFYFAGNKRFSSNNAITTLYKTNSNACVECFANGNNGWIDFQTSNTTDYACRINANYSGSTNGNGNLNFYANRVHLYYSNAVKQIDYGYLNSSSSFLRGRGSNTWINFHNNNEIYYYLAGSTKMTSATNGYHYAVFHVNTSDLRLKSNIVDVNDALTTINKLKVKEFDKKCSLECDADECETSHEIGFIAQEVEEIDELNFCITTSQLNDTKALKDSSIFALNVKATQELYHLVMKQQEEINLLKEKLSYLNV